jgi:hypothetical protein
MIIQVTGNNITGNRKPLKVFEQERKNNWTGCAKWRGKRP